MFGELDADESGKAGVAGVGQFLVERTRPQTPSKGNHKEVV